MNRPRHAFAALALAAALTSLAACGAVRQDRHKTRVENVLAGLKAEGGTTGDKLNYAMIEWDGGQRKFESIDTEGVFDRFTRWCLEKNVNRQIASYEVVGVESDGSTTPPTSVVSVRVEGVPLRIRVGDEKRMTWVD
jgi:hypothetical protein